MSRQILPADILNRRQRIMAVDDRMTALVSAQSKVVAELDLTTATITGAGYSSVPDLRASNPAVQSVDARRPVNGTSGNGLAIATYATQSVLSWPLTANNYKTVKYSVAGWFKATSTTGNQSIFEVRAGTAGASTNSFSAILQSGRMNLFAYMNANDGKQKQAGGGDAITAGTYFWLRWLYDSTGATDDLKIRLFKNGTEITASAVNLGAGATLGALQSGVTGNALIGGINNSASPNQPLNGVLGTKLRILNDNLTAAEETVLMALDHPT